MSDVFVSSPAGLVVHPSGWVALPSGAEITRMPVWDGGAQLYARLGHGPAGAWLRSHGMRLPTVSEYVQLHALSLHIDPYTMPTAEMIRAVGISRPYEKDGRDTPAMRDYRAGNMRSRAWCCQHDEEVLERLANAGWNWQPVANAGKHWAAGGVIVGWWRRNGSLIQHPSDAHKSQPEHTDYGTTFHAAREVGGRVIGVGSIPPVALTQLGDRGPAVVAMQKWLLSTGQRLPRYGADGDHGPETQAALEAWRSDRVPDTEPAPVVGAATYHDLVSEYIQARNYTRADRTYHTLQAIVLHSVEQPVRAGTAHSVAMWFAGPSAPQASAHFVVGPEAVIQCVELQDVAWAAPGANRTGIQVEMVGQAERTEWLSAVGDRPGLAVAQRTAALCLALCRECGIPVQDVDAAGLLAGRRGITTHASVTEAYHRSTHVDPAMPGDRRWDWERFLRMVREG